MSKHGRMVLQKPVLGRHSLANVFKHTNHIGSKVTYQTRPVGRLHPLLQQVIPVDVLEERVILQKKSRDPVPQTGPQCQTHFSSWATHKQTSTLHIVRIYEWFILTKHIKNYLRKNNIPQFIIYMCIAAHKSRCSFHGTLRYVELNLLFCLKVHWVKFGLIIFILVKT